ncbi:MAG TPA: hypothetical protein VFR80_13945 [Pyrinomonadaceae bacterium]|nr:hypothetical protein [Pyrinomonadaceae bacterium]
MTSSLRKFALTAHITFSLGWLGAVVACPILAIVGLTSHGGAGSTNARLRSPIRQQRRVRPGV